MSEPRAYQPAIFPPNGERIVSMVNFKDRIIVATDCGIYELVDGVLRRLEILEAK